MESEPDSTGRVTRRWRIAVGAILSIVGTLVGLHEARWSIPSDKLAFLGALAFLLVGGVSGGRNLVQRRIGYLDWVDPHPAWSRVLAFFRNWENPEPTWNAAHRKRLARLTTSSGRIAIGLLAAGGWFLVNPHNALQLGVTSVLGWAFIATAFQTHDVLQVPGAPPRGTDRIEKCRPVRETREAFEKMEDAAPFLLTGYRFAVSPTRRTQLSGLAVVLMLMFPVIATGHVVAVAPEVVETFVPERPAETQPEKQEPKPTQSPRSGADGSPPPAQSAAPRPARCQRAVRPGTGAPRAQAKELRRVWNVYPGMAVVCAQTARRVPGTEVYYVLGFVDRFFVSIAVAEPDRPAVLLVGSPAHLARGLTQTGALRGVSERLPIGGGDFVLVESEVGAWVVIRPDDSSDAGYVRLPPGLADLWLRYGERFEPTWPRHAGSAGRFTFHSQTDGKKRVASGFCAGDTTCRFEAKGISWESLDPAAWPVTVERVLSQGPG